MEIFTIILFILLVIISFMYIKLKVKYNKIKREKEINDYIYTDIH